MNIEEELRQQEQEALSRWKSPQMAELLEQIIVLIKKEKPWMHLLESTPGYFYDGKDLSGAPLSHLSLYKLNLKGIVFSFAKCQGIDFTNCFMADCNFFHTDFTNANLSKTYLDECTLDGAILKNANLSHSTLKGASFCLADVRGVDFTNANLRGANFFDAKTEGAIFDGADLTDAIFGKSMDA